MPKQSVVEMLRRPIQQPTSRLTGLEHATQLITELHTLLEQKDEEIAALHATVTWLRQQYEGSARKPMALPELVFEITGRDLNGHIKTLKAVPRNA